MADSAVLPQNVDQPIGSILMNRTQTRGFTLLELMITVAVMSIALGIGVPSYNRMMATSQMAAASNDLLVLMQNARAQAMRTRNRVIVCPSTNGTTCSGSNWTNAISGLDANRNNTIDSTEQVFRRVRLSPKVAATNNADLPLIFLPDGTTRMGDATDDGIEDPEAITICVEGMGVPSRTLEVGFSSAQTQIVIGAEGDCL